MCKHFTIVPIADEITLQRPIAAMFVEALRESSMDGDNYDGIGIGYANGGSFVVNKSGEHPLITVVSDEFVQTLLDINYTAQPVLGHVRKASFEFQKTRDAKAAKFPDKDAHPFAVGPNMLCHNGTITNYKELVKEHKLAAENTDTYALAQLFSGKDIFDLDSLNSVTEMCRGTFALIMQNILYPQKLVLCSHGKPLYSCVVEGLDGPMFGIIATSENAIHIAIPKIERVTRIITGASPWLNWRVSKIEEDKWFIWDRGIFGDSGELAELGKVKYRKEYAVTTQPYSYGGYRQTGGHRATASVVNYNQNEIVANARVIADRIISLLEIFPITSAEFRYLYWMLNREDPDAEMVRSEVETTASYLEYLLEDPSRYAYLEEFLNVNIVPPSGQEKTFKIERKIDEIIEGEVSSWNGNTSSDKDKQFGSFEL